MRFLEFDQFEFDTSSSEEHLRIVLESVSRDTRNSSIEAFLKSAWNEQDQGNVPALPVPTFLGACQNVVAVTTYLHQFIGVTAQANWRCFVLADQWDETILLLEPFGMRMLYCWNTSA